MYEKKKMNNPVMHFDSAAVISPRRGRFMASCSSGILRNINTAAKGSAGT